MSAQPDTDTNTGSIVAVGLIGSILLVVTVVALEALYGYVAQAEWTRKVVEIPDAGLRTYHAEQAERLNAYRLVDPATGTVTIPIERAMQLVADEAAVSAAATRARDTGKARNAVPDPPR